MGKKKKKSSTMLLYNSKKKQRNQNAKGERLLITVNVVGSPGPLRFVVFEGQLVSKVIDTSLKNYGREGRLPVLGTDPNDLLLYCPHAGQQPLNPWETIGSFGARSFILCKKSQGKVERVGSDAVSHKGTVTRKMAEQKCQEEQTNTNDKENVDEVLARGVLDCTSYMGKFKLNLDARFQMPKEINYWHRQCKCEPSHPVILTTCWEGTNKGRRILKCAESIYGGGCGYLKFIDASINGRALYVVEFMYDLIEQLVLENTVAREKLARAASPNLPSSSDATPTRISLVDEPLIYDEIIDEFRPSKYKM